MDALSDPACLLESKQVIKHLEHILKSEFFGVIKQFSGSAVEKYWLTGVLPAFRDGISPLTATQLISFDQRYQSLCGLTQEDVDAIVTRTLRDLPESDPARILDSLKRWYNGYRFGLASPRSVDSTLYNPQLVFVHLRNVISAQPPLSYIGEANAIHTATVLSAVGETGPVTIHNLLDTLFCSKVEGKILKELSFAELTQDLKIRSSNVTWSLLYYLGVVTLHEHSGYLCVPNRSMVELVSPRMSSLGEVLIIDLVPTD